MEFFRLPDGSILSLHIRSSMEMNKSLNDKQYDELLRNRFVPALFVEDPDIDEYGELLFRIPIFRWDEEFYC